MEKSAGASLPILATITPYLNPLVHGDTIEARTPEYDEYSAPGNFNSPGHQIVSVVETFLGDAVDETTVLNAGQQAGIILSVTDDAVPPNVVLFETGTITVSATIPGQVPLLDADPQDGQALLTVTPPLSDGGSAIIDYEYQRNVAGAGWVDISDGVGAVTSYLDTGLTNGLSHQWQARARNAIGPGAWSPIAQGVPGAATAPVITLVSYNPTTGQVVFNIDQPAEVIVGSFTDVDAPGADGSGGWTPATNVIETFTQFFGGSGNFSLSFANQTANRWSMFARANGLDGPLIATQVLTFPPASNPDLSFNKQIIQATTLGAVGEAETSVGFIPAAGKYSLVMGEIVSGVFKTYTLSGPGVTAVQRFTRSAGNNDINLHVFEIDATGPADLTVTVASGNNDSFNRSLFLNDATDLNLATAVFNGAADGTQDVEAGPIASNASVAAGRWALAATIGRNMGAGVSVAWGGSLVAGDKKGVDAEPNAEGRVSIAIKEVTALTEPFDAAPTFSGLTGSNGRAATVLMIAEAL